MDGKTVRLSLPGLIALLLTFFSLGSLSRPAAAAVVEISGMAAYTSANFGDGYSTVSRRYTGTVDFKFTPVSALEFEYTDGFQELDYPTDLGGRLATNIKEQDTYKDII